MLSSSDQWLKKERASRATILNTKKWEEKRCEKSAPGNDGPPVGMDKVEKGKETPQKRDPLKEKRIPNWD